MYATLGPTVASLPKQAAPFYQSKEWVELRGRVIRRDGGACQLRLRGCLGSRGRMFVDHVIEIQDGGERLDPANCQTVCSSCHVQKTNRERAKRNAR